LIAGRTKSIYITEHSIPKPNPSDVKISKNVGGNLKDNLELVGEFEVEKFFKLAAKNISE
jgi:hypothetical protein